MKKTSYESEIDEAKMNSGMDLSGYSRLDGSEVTACFQGTDEESGEGEPDGGIDDQFLDQEEDTNGIIESEDFAHQKRRGKLRYFAEMENQDIINDTIDLPAYLFREIKRGNFRIRGTNKNTYLCYLQNEIKKGSIRNGDDLTDEVGRRKKVQTDVSNNPILDENGRTTPTVIGCNELFEGGKTIPKEDIYICNRFQRDRFGINGLCLKDGNIDSAIRQFDWNKCQAITVIKWKQAYFVINGQGRLISSYFNPQVTEIPAVIYDFNIEFGKDGFVDSEEELPYFAYELFLSSNTSFTSITQNQRFDYRCRDARNWEHEVVEELRDEYGVIYDLGSESAAQNAKSMNEARRCSQSGDKYCHKRLLTQNILNQILTQIHYSSKRAKKDDFMRAFKMVYVVNWQMNAPKFLSNVLICNYIGNGRNYIGKESFVKDAADRMHMSMDECLDRMIDGLRESESRRTIIWKPKAKSWDEAKKVIPAVSNAHEMLEIAENIRGNSDVVPFFFRLIEDGNLHGIVESYYKTVIGEARHVEHPKILASSHHGTGR